jgi:glycine cleavage system H protein
VAGTVSAINSELAEKPELINQDPYGAGWFCEIEVSRDAEIQGMLDPDAYRQLTE